MLAFLFSPNGRFNRMQWWLFAVVQVVMTAVAIMMFIGGISAHTSPLMLAAVLALIPIVWSGLCANIKRFHDRDKSGLWILIGFIPIIGSIWLFVELGLMAGSDGDNRFGPPHWPGSGSGGTADPAGGSTSKLTKIDDDYFRRFQEQNANAALAAPGRTAAPAAGTRPTFGKRA